MDGDRTVGAVAVDRGGHGGGIIHHQQVTRPQIVAEVGESGMADAARPGDQQLGLVPGDAARFRRPGSLRRE